METKTEKQAALEFLKLLEDLEDVLYPIGYTDDYLKNFDKKDENDRTEDNKEGKES